MVEISKIVVKPSSSKKENFYVLLATVIIMIFAFILLKLTVQKQEDKTFEKNEISSLELNSVESIMFSEFQNFINEFPYLYEQKEIPTIKKLDEELFISPFTKDAAWEARGEHEFSLFTNDNEAIYLGISKDENTAGNFAVKINLDTLEGEIRYTKHIDIAKLNTEEVFKFFNHMNIIIPFTGDDMLEEMKGR